MICVIVGPPGSGKGTQAESIAADLRVPHVSTGELLRAEAAAGTPLGREVGPLLAAGELVPDDLVERLGGARAAGADGAPGAHLGGSPPPTPPARGAGTRPP